MHLDFFYKKVQKMNDAIQIKAEFSLLIYLYIYQCNI